MPGLDHWGEEYIRLGFRIHQHIDGYVDAYFGPPTLREAVLAQPPLPPAELIAAADRLATALEASDYPARRRTYLHKQLTAMTTTCRQIAGEQLPYREEIRRCFDIDPTPIPEDTFEDAIEELQTLLPGNGPVSERMVAWRKQFEIAGATAQPLLALIEAELRQRTQALYPLPAGEKVEFRLVNDQPWSGYNWYYGNYQSGVDINTDLPLQANTLTHLIAHEAYPGHHTEHCLKEAGLYAERGWAEQSIFLLNTPECVMAEGIANSGQKVIFGPGEMLRWQAATVYPAAGLAGDPHEPRIVQAAAALAGVSGNAALLLHDEGRTEADVVRYIMRYGLLTEDRARQRLRFLAAPLWRSYIFTYFYGEHMIEQWLERGDPVERFGTLLRDQIYPSLLERWIIDERASCGVGG